MIARTLAGVALCALLVPLVSALPPGPVVERTRWNDGHAAMASRAAQDAAVPLRAGRLERRGAGAGLETAIADVQRGADAAWVAWSVRAIRGTFVDRDRSGDDGGAGGVCTLREDGSIDRQGSSRGPAERLTILVRSERDRLTAVAFTDDRCVLDAGPRTVFWLDAVAPADSVRLLAGMVRQGRTAGEDARELRSPGREALPALALHDDAAADSALAGFVAAGESRQLRRDAAFWLGAARGARSTALLQRLAREDADPAFRKHLAFVLTLVGEPGIDTLVQLARHDGHAGVRRQALFWLGQKAGERAAGEIGRALDEDPDREVRKHAVFALSQLPAGEGVPRLIAVARSHRDPAVRKQAMFWLGQSGDERALAFFEDVLSRRP
jgi:hypothetical protein